MGTPSALGLFSLLSSYFRQLYKYIIPNGYDDSVLDLTRVLLKVQN